MALWAVHWRGWGRQHCSTGCCCCCGDWRRQRLTDRVMERAARTPPTQHHQLSQEQMLGRNYFHRLLLLRYHVRRAFITKANKIEAYMGRVAMKETSQPTYQGQSFFSPQRISRTLKGFTGSFLSSNVIGCFHSPTVTVPDLG